MTLKILAIVNSIYNFRSFKHKKERSLKSYI